MQTWKLLLIILLSAVLIGCIVGVLSGKHQLKKKSGNYKPLLSIRERIIYAACILVGAGCIAAGILYQPDGQAQDAMMGMEGGMEFADGLAGEGIMIGEGMEGENPLMDDGAADMEGDFNAINPEDNLDDATAEGNDQTLTDDDVSVPGESVGEDETEAPTDEPDAQATDASNERRQSLDQVAVGSAEEAVPVD